MDFGIEEKLIPGTILERTRMGGATGGEFLDKIFYITDGVMLAQIREIAGIDGSTLQNWLKRGWVVNPKNKMYTKDQLARILLINMMRDTMQLCDISFLLTYVNGDPADLTDDIIPESQLYDYLCRVLDRLTGAGEISRESLVGLIGEVTADYEEKLGGARRRLTRALEIILMSYYANLVKRRADELVAELRGSGRRNK
jgi:DNA-binding transcriptional MerR regulator